MFKFYLKPNGVGIPSILKFIFISLEQSSEFQIKTTLYSAFNLVLEAVVTKVKSFH